MFLVPWQVPQVGIPSVASISSQIAVNTHDAMKEKGTVYIVYMVYTQFTQNFQTNLNSVW
jgi:hypothetical protein